MARRKRTARTRTAKRTARVLPLVRHEEFVRVITPSFILAIIGGILTILAATVFGAGAISPARAMSDPYVGIVITFTLGFLGVLMLVAAWFLRKENYCLAGSILALITGSIGFALGAAFWIGWIGPLLAIVSGVIGIREHEELIRHTSKLLR